jgi:hypothetical protein
MATAAETQSIIQLVVGMVNAAPGADILAELEDIIDSGLTIEELAVAISENPAYSGDTGLFPDFLPNAIFADNFLTQLIGSEVTEEVLTAAVDEMTASLNAGDSRGVAMNAAIDALAASTDPDLADAAAALANKTAVATYYSVDVAESSAELDDLIAVVSGVDSSATAVDDGTDAVDGAVAAGQGLAGLLSLLDAANADKKAFLVTADGDGKATTSKDEAEIGTDVTDAYAGIAGANAPLAGYAVASAGLKAALIADEVALRAKALSDANKALAAAQSNTTASPGGTDQVPGLEAAVLADNAADLNVLITGGAAILADGERTGAETGYDNIPGNAALTGTADVNGAYAGVITYSAITKTLSLATLITETTNPGVTALLAATQANQAAIGAAAGATTAATLSQRVEENLDQDTAGAAALVVATGKMTVINPGVTGKATVAELDAETAGLASIVTALDAAVLANADPETTHVAAIGALNTAIGLLADGNAVAIAVLTATAADAGYITAADKTAIDLTAAVTADAQTALAANNATFRSADWSTAVTGTLAVYEALDNVTARADAYNTAAGDITTTTAAVAAFDKLLVAEADALGIAAGLKAVNTGVTAANAAFAPAGHEVPEPVDVAIESATTKDDVFLAGTIDSSILSFGGDDVLFVGADAVLNADTKAGANGDDAVTEVWITGTTSAVITIETSVFGSSAATPEVVTITLTGVAAADVSYADGFVSIV